VGARGCDAGVLQLALQAGVGNLLGQVAGGAHLRLAQSMLLLDPLQGFHSWSKLGETINAHIANSPHPAGYFLVSDSGTRVAEAVFYTGNRYLGVDFFRPERYLFLAQADEKLRGKNAIILGGTNTNEFARYGAYFRKVEMIGFYAHTYRGETIHKNSNPIFKGEDYLGNWAQLNPIPPRELN